jgi:hypothetical protein
MTQALNTSPRRVSQQSLIPIMELPAPRLKCRSPSGLDNVASNCRASLGSSLSDGLREQIQLADSRLE